MPTTIASGAVFGNALGNSIQATITAYGQRSADAECRPVGQWINDLFNNPLNTYSGDSDGSYHNSATLDGVPVNGGSTEDEAYDFDASPTSPGGDRTMRKRDAVGNDVQEASGNGPSDAPAIWSRHKRARPPGAIFRLLANWPRSWRADATDLAIGQDLVECFTPFLIHLLQQGLGPQHAAPTPRPSS